MTPSAEIAAFELLKKSGFTGDILAASNISPEQARDTIFFATGVRIPAGLIEHEIRRSRASRPQPSSPMDTVSDFQADPLGRWHTAQTGVTGKPTTDLYKLIANQRV